MKAEVRPGVTTQYLDEIGARVIAENGARSAPAMVYQFPGANCISVNDEAVHGVPSERRLTEGDLVKLDVTVEKNGYMRHTAITFPVGRVSPKAERFVALAESASKKP